MAENNENFRDELIKLAQVVEIVENSFIGNEKVTFETKLNENRYSDLISYLGKDINESKIKVSIGNFEFIFLKK